MKIKILLKKVAENVFIFVETVKKYCNKNIILYLKNIDFNWPISKHEKNCVIWTIFKTWTTMLLEQILNKIFILCQWFSKHEQLCYLDKFSIKTIIFFWTKISNLYYVNKEKLPEKKQKIKK